MNSDRNNATVKRTSGKHLGKVAPSTKAHEVYVKNYGIVHVGSRTSCNRFWVAMPASERQNAVVQVAKGHW